MNHNLKSPPAPWTAQRWGVVIAAVLGGQLAAIFWLSRYTPPTIPAPPNPFPPRIVLHDFESLSPERYPWLSDPGQLALVGRRGFSATLWSRLPRVEASFSEWEEPPLWLTRDSQELVSALDPTGDLPLSRELNVLGKPNPVYVAPVAPPSSPRRPGSKLRIEGDLARRPLTSALDLPSWVHPDILQSTTVQVLVNRHGAVLSGALLSSSGLAAADRRAAELALAANFLALPGSDSSDDLVWGRLVFLWHTLAPTTTNGLERQRAALPSES